MKEAKMVKISKSCGRHLKTQKRSRPISPKHSQQTDRGLYIGCDRYGGREAKGTVPAVEGKTGLSRESLYKSFSGSSKA